jgi:sigma-B regulation protein RsbU (phosphoserine phosphatase)
MDQITVPAKLDNLDAVMDFVGGHICETGMDSQRQSSIEVAVEEIFVNIASYSYGDGDGDVTIRVETCPEKIVVEFKDSGYPYDPLAKEDPDITLALTERDIGGLGILLVKKMMDEVRYVYRDGQNILTIRKNL